MFIPAVYTIFYEPLLELYEKENLSLLEIAARLGVSYPTVRKELKRHGIQARRRGDLLRKYPRLDELEIGDHVRVSQPLVKQPYGSFYYIARVAGIKVSVKSIGNETLLITRIDK